MRSIWNCMRVRFEVSSGTEVAHAQWRAFHEKRIFWIQFRSHSQGKKKKKKKKNVVCFLAESDSLFLCFLFAYLFSAFFSLFQFQSIRWSRALIELALILFTPRAGYFSFICLHTDNCFVCALKSNTFRFIWIKFGWASPRRHILCTSIGVQLKRTIIISPVIKIFDAFILEHFRFPSRLPRLITTDRSVAKRDQKNEKFSAQNVAPSEWSTSTTRTKTMHAFRVERIK